MHMYVHVFLYDSRNTPKLRIIQTHWTLGSLQQVPSQNKEQTIYPTMFACAYVFRNPTSGVMGCFAFATCGDIHENPGSDSVGNRSSSSSICSAETFQNMLSILH